MVSVGMLSLQTMQNLLMVLVVVIFTLNTSGEFLTLHGLTGRFLHFILCTLCLSFFLIKIIILFFIIIYISTSI